MEKAGPAVYAMKSCDTRGREHSEAEDRFRSVYQRDRDRIIHSTAFRRLEYKTQVFVNHEGDNYRTRLTHTLEVSQIARSLAKALRLNEELAEAISLAHDLGHTPFGHSGERVLNNLMKGHGGFEHNKHSLRVVECLERKYPDFPGLNLTYEVREGIAKHKTPFDHPEFEGFEPELMATLESQVAAVSDEAAYYNHDVDDGLTSGILKDSQMDDVEILREARKDVLSRYPGIDLEKDPEMLRSQIVRTLIHRQVSDLIDSSLAALKETGVKSVDDVRNAGRLLVGFSPEMRRKIKELGSFLLERFYGNYRVKRMSGKAAIFLEKLFNAYINDPLMLPDTSRTRTDSEEPHRVVCDYVAGMTDRYALDEYKKLFEPYERV